MYHRIVMLISCLVLTQGCASLDKEECARGNWYAIGKKDGQYGHSTERYQSHISACKQHGYATNLAEYTRGREAGLKKYCTALGGLRSGELGLNYKGSCPSEALRDFRYGFDLGRDIYYLQRDLDDVRYEIHDSRLRRLDRADNKHRHGYHRHHGSHEHYLRQRELRLELRLRELRGRANELILEHRTSTDLAPLD